MREEGVHAQADRWEVNTCNGWFLTHDLWKDGRPPLTS